MPFLEKDLWTGIFHCHTHFSKDAQMKPEDIVNEALAEHWDFVIVTDHNTIKGSQAVRDLIAQRNLPMQAPLAAEYFTEYGDVVAMFIQEEIVFSSFIDLATQVKRQGGFLILPHPYVSHNHIEHMLPYVQFIEIFNGRTPETLNHNADILCESHSLRPIYGSDAHLSKNLRDVVIQVPRQKSLQESFLKGPVIPMRLRQATKGDYLRSRWIYTLKSKQKQIPQMILRTAWNMVNGAWFRAIG
jgi:predicted metal-dependent phosphoesterase TrpH